MRQSRLKAPEHFPVAYYHCISRVVNREFVFGDEEKEEFVKLMRHYEQFCGVRVVTYCVMSNHFHVLVEVPKRPEQMPSDEELLARLKGTTGPEGYGTTRQLLERFRKEGQHEAAEELRESFFRRMWDVSYFMKGLKQRFSSWFNRRQGRRGTLWEERFKSVLVEGAGEALGAMAGYIDLNPVRAGIVEDSKDYRWCGYAEAVAGGKRARTGLRVVTDAVRRREGGTRSVLPEYRVLLFGRGEEKGLDENGKPLRRGFSREKVEKVLAEKGNLTRWEMLRCRVRYFADGAVIGGKAFVNTVFAAERHRFGEKRKTGARRLRGLRGVEGVGLYAVRDLRLAPFS